MTRLIDAADISVNGKAVLAKVRAALAEIVKCEPVAYMIGNADSDVTPYGAVYRLKNNAQAHIDSYKDNSDLSIIPLYTSPQPIEREVPESIKELIRNQQPLPADMNKILHDNLFDLYEGAPVKTVQREGWVSDERRMDYLSNGGWYEVKELHNEN